MTCGVRDAKREIMIAMREHQQFRPQFRFRQDLIDIGGFIAAQDVRAADRLLDTFDAKCQMLAAARPELSALREDLAPWRAHP